MQTESKSHPAKDQLIAFGQGKLAADESSSVEQHLEVCRECCETLLDLKDDTFVGLVKIANVADAASVGVAVGTDSGSVGHGTGKSAHPPEGRPEQAATVLVQSGEPVGPDELPAELAEHPRYRIVELIGRGGMGNVYRAEHRLMNRAVAIKLINSQLMQHPHAVERFRREVQAAAKLSHPNIVAAYDAEQAGNAHFLVMEFVEGTDLASVVKHRGPMSVAEACECIRQAATGLQHAHEKGMVHRDIKPHNLMLAASGQVRILDFGLAGFASEAAFESSPVAPRQESRTSDGTDLCDQPSDTDPAATRDRLSCRGATGLLEATAAHLTTIGSVMGTPDYMAPEQAADAHSADIRADIYSLGCTLHFLLTGKPPFEADNVLMKLKAHAQEPPPSLTTLRKDVPVEFAKVVARMMAKNPAKRFQTPAAVAEALAPFAEPSASPPRRRIGRAIATAFLFAAMILAAVIIYVQTDTGQFEIQATDEVAVLIEQSKLKIRDKVTGREYQLTAGKHSIRKGEYVINVTELPDGVTVDTDKFRLTRGGKERVTVSFKPKESPAPKTAREESPSVARTDFAEVGRFTGHEGSAYHAIVSPSGRYGISCGSDKTIRVWEIATQEEKWVLKGHEGSVFGLAISTDGKLLASGDRAKSIRLWNLETREQVGELTGHTEAVTDLAFMPDRTHLLSAGFDSTLRLWHVADRKLVRTIDIGTVVEKMVPLPDGRRVMLSGAHTRGWGPRIYDLEKGEKIDATLNGYSCMAVSTDGRMSLIGSLTGVLVVRDTVNDKVIVQMTDPRAATARDAAARDAAITPDGRFAITTTREKQMHLWDLHQGKLLSTAELDRISTITLSPDGRFALTIGQGGISVWRLPESVLEPIAAVPNVTDEARLQGKWIAVSGHARKKPLTAAELAQLSITFDGDRVEIVSHTGPATPQAATFTVNPNRDPKQIDFVAPNKSESMPGIYQFDGDRLKLALIDQDYSRPTNFDPDHRPDHLTVTLERVPVVAALGQEEQTAFKAAEAYLAVVDADKFDQLFDIGSNLAKKQAPREQILQTYQTIRNTLGRLEKRTLRRVRLIDEFIGVPAGRYAAVQFVSDFEKHKGLWETVMLNVDDDGQWRANTYAATVHPLPLPRPKTKSEPGAVIKTPRQPEEVIEPPQ